MPSSRRPSRVMVWTRSTSMMEPSAIIMSRKDAKAQRANFAPWRLCVRFFLTLLGGEIAEEVVKRLLLVVFGALHRFDVGLVLLDLRLLLIELVQVTLVGGGR